LKIVTLYENTFFENLGIQPLLAIYEWNMVKT